MNFARTAYTIRDNRTGTCSGAWTETAKDMADMNARLQNAAFKQQGLPECFEVIPVLLGGKMTCKGCHGKVESDGHGELIHVTPDGTPGTYGCEPKAPKNGPYPVAR